MISLFQTEHFRNFRASGIGTVKQQAVEKTSKKDLKLLKEIEFCLSCKFHNKCLKGDCKELKEFRKILKEKI